MAPGAVAVLTDSTASLPTETAREHGITVVPLHVVLEGRGAGAVVRDGPSGNAALAGHLRAEAGVSTSQPSVGELADAMHDALRGGATGLVCLHLSADLSGTVDGARAAARHVERERGVPVRVVDTRTVAGGLGLAALAAAEAAQAGQPVDAVAAVAREVAAKSLVLFAVPDLEYLRRGGRISGASSVVGAALGIRPVLGIDDGRVAVVETVRGMARARRRMVARAVQWAGGPGARRPHPPTGRVRLAVHHFDAAEQARVLQDELMDEVVATGAVVSEVLRSEVTAVVGAHTGPGVLAVVVAPAP